MGVKSWSRLILFWVGSSLVNILKSCEEARCSEGSRVGVQMMSSRKSMVIFFNLWLASKSCNKKCNDSQTFVMRSDHLNILLKCRWSDSKCWFRVWSSEYFWIQCQWSHYSVRNQKWYISTWTIFSAVLGFWSND